MRVLDGEDFRTIAEQEGYSGIFLDAAVRHALKRVAPDLYEECLNARQIFQTMKAMNYVDEFKKRAVLYMMEHKS